MYFFIGSEFSDRVPQNVKLPQAQRPFQRVVKVLRQQTHRKLVNRPFHFQKRCQDLTCVHERYDSLLSDHCAAAFQRWRTLPFDRTLNGIHTLLQNPRFLILDTASLTATNVAIHPHRQRSAAIAHVAIHAQYDSRAFALVRRGI